MTDGDEISIRDNVDGIDRHDVDDIITIVKSPDPQLSAADQRLIGAIDRDRRIDLTQNAADGLAVITLVELAQIRETLGDNACNRIRILVKAWLATQPGSTKVVNTDESDSILLLVEPGRRHEIRRRLERLSNDLLAMTFSVDGENLRLTPAVGFACFESNASHRSNGSVIAKPEELSTAEVLKRARRATQVAAERLDLTTVGWIPQLGDETALPPPHSLTRRFLARVLPASTFGQIALTFLVGLLVPYAFYSLLGAYGIQFTGAVYDILVIAFVLTAGSIWIECLLALDPPRPPNRAAAPYPKASALIAAYLPNESATIIDTLDAFLALEYPGELEIILAYNTPQPLPIEHELALLAEREPRLQLFRVEGSTSKAQNVNAALSITDGEMIGIFDADHHPDKGNFERAWRWISTGVDIVQGHCVVRNGDASWVSRLVAVEFESIYAASHPGRARFHDFGIFGGSNGYWRADLLRKVRMHGNMLTEDIDSSLRALEKNAHIASDPALRSRELAPTSLSALYHQRMRWAQGWFQVSLKHLLRLSHAPEISIRQRIGLGFLIGWGQIYPWIGLQIYPFLAYLALNNGHKMYWLIPFFLATSLFTFSVGPGQTLFAYLLATPEVRGRRRWFVAYFVLAALFYTEFKNVVSRVAQLKELRGESKWRVTARTTDEETVTEKAA